MRGIIIIKKRKIKITLIIGAIVLIWGVMFGIDLLRAHNRKPPIFCISFAEYSVDTGAVGYTGLFYKVEKTILKINGDTQSVYKVYSWFY